MKLQSNLKFMLKVALFASLAAGAHLTTPLRAADQINDDVLVVEIQGVVEISPKGADTWVRTETTNQALHAADRLRTGSNSRAALRWSDQSVMQLGALTELEILAHPSNEEPGLHLLQGILSFFHRDKPGRI